MAETTGFQVLLVDDDAESRHVMREMLTEHGGFPVAGEASCKTEALAALEDRPVDVVFSDIQMAGGSGFELAEMIHRRWPDVLVVFLTGYADFAVDGYFYGPVDFLVKPVSRERLDHALVRLSERLGREEQRSGPDGRIGLPTEDGYRIIDVADIAYLEKLDRRIRILWRDGSSSYIAKTMQELEDILVSYDFFRCHKSYLAPLGDVLRIQKERVGRYYKLWLKGGVELPLSRQKYYELREILSERGI